MAKMKGQSFSRNLFFLTILFVCFSEVLLFSQSSGKRPSRQNVIDAYNNGEYGDAYNYASELLKLFPKDPLYKYYAGVSLVNLESDPQMSVQYLSESYKGSGVARSVPTDVLFWLGRAQQQDGRYAEAIQSFNDYSSLVSKKQVKEMGIPAFLQQCSRNEGAIDASKLTPVAENRGSQEKKEPQPEVTTTISEKQAVESDLSLPKEYDDLLTQALDSQYKVDSINRMLDEKLAAAETLPYAEKVAVRKDVTDERAVADSLQRVVDDSFESFNEIPQDLSFESISRVEQSDMASDNVISPEVARAEVNREESSVEESLAAPDGGTTPANESVTLDNADPLGDTASRLTVDDGGEEAQETLMVTDVVLPDMKTRQSLTSLFEYRVNPLIANDDVVINPELPQGLIYRIQVAVFRNPVKMGDFKGLSPVYGFKPSGSQVTTYHVGMFRFRADANDALLDVRKAGFKDAFIIAQLSGKNISSERASTLEKEWGAIPFTTNDFNVPDAPVDTLPPVLSYRVEIARVKQPVKEDELNDFKRLSGSRGLDITLVDDGNVVYLIGKFVSFESAEEYANLVSRNGYPEAKVSAWLGNREIPIETANQLFDML